MWAMMAMHVESGGQPHGLGLLCSTKSKRWWGLHPPSHLTGLTTEVFQVVGAM